MQISLPYDHTEPTPPPADIRNRHQTPRSSFDATYMEIINEKFTQVGDVPACRKDCVQNSHSDEALAFRPQSDGPPERTRF